MELINNKILLQGLLDGRYKHSNQETADVFCSVKIFNGDEVDIYGRISTDFKQEEIDNVHELAEQIHIGASHTYSISDVEKKIIDYVTGLRAEWFEKGQKSVKRRNESGCCCVIDNDDKVVSVCGAHSEWANQIDNMLYQVYKFWKLGASKGTVWDGLKRIFLEYEERFPDKKENKQKGDKDCKNDGNNL